MFSNDSYNHVLNLMTKIVTNFDDLRFISTELIYQHLVDDVISEEWDNLTYDEQRGIAADIRDNLHECLAEQHQMNRGLF